MSETRMWAGGIGPSDFPHRCPFRVDGATKDDCVTLSGQSCVANRQGCFGTARAMVKFASCTSEERRCIVCLEKGRIGRQANSVTDYANGVCDEHRLVEQESGESPGKVVTRKQRVQFSLSQIDLLTPAQFRLMEYVSKECNNAQIARFLNVSERSVQGRLFRIYEMFGLKDLTRIEKRAVLVEVGKEYLAAYPEKRTLRFTQEFGGVDMVVLELKINQFLDHGEQLLSFIGGTRRRQQPNGK